MDETRPAQEGSRLRRWLAPGAALLLTGIAFVAAWATTSPTFDPGPAAKKPQAFVLGRPGLWQSLASAADVRVRASGRYWLAFRAFRLGDSGLLSLHGPHHLNSRIRIAREPGVYFSGPFRFAGPTRLTMTGSAAPAASVSGVAGPLFIADLRLTREPLVGIAGAGFWAAEQNLQGDLLSWLGDRGVVEVHDADTRPANAWLSFDTTSVDHARTLRVQAAGTTRDYQVPERGATRHLVLGPVPLRRGSGVLVMSSPNPAAYGGDARVRSIEIQNLQAFATRGAASR